MKKIKIEIDSYNKVWQLVHALEKRLFEFGQHEYCDICRDEIFNKECLNNKECEK